MQVAKTRSAQKKVLIITIKIEGNYYHRSAKSAIILPVVYMSFALRIAAAPRSCAACGWYEEYSGKPGRQRGVARRNGNAHKK
jgi:hypothetical protein